MNTSLNIAIVGGGPAGLTLARILHVHGIAATVFEREAHAAERPQGGTLDLHADSGQLALRQAGLEAEFLRIARYDDQGNRLLDKQAQVLFEDADTSAGDRPEVDRTALRQVLLDALPADCVRWNSNLREVQAREDGRWDLAFDGGTQGPFDLVVGADGAWSRVRPLLSSYTPQYSGLTFIEFGIDDVDDAHPHISALVGRGKLEVESDSKSIIAQRNGNAHVRGYAIFRVPRDCATRTFDFSKPAEARTLLAAQFDGWHPDILALIHSSNDQIIPRLICALPVGHHWAHRPGLTLIGDAAHLMSPYSGEGVNVAMLDAAELARHLIENRDWPQAVASFERDMLQRVTEVAEHSAEAAAVQLSHDGLAHTLEHLRSHRPEQAV